MTFLFILLGIISGVAIAYLLNKIFADKIEDKTHRIGLKVTSYIVCIILSILFSAIGSLRAILDGFIDNRIEFVEIKLGEVFPNSNILDTSIDTNELTLVVGELQKAVKDIDTGNDGFFERLIFNAFMNKLNGYVNAVEKGANTVIIMSDENGLVTIKSILFNLKDTALDTVSPYFIFGQIVIVVLLLIFFGIFAGVVLFLKKGGAIYNDSIVFGDIKYDDDKENTKRKE
jgi:hypothetical protein